MPAWPSASESGPTSFSWAWKAIPCGPAATCSTPLCAPSNSQSARVVGCAQPISGPSLAAQVGQGALVDDFAAVHDRDAVAQFLDLGQLVAREQDGDAFVGQVADQSPHVAHPGRVQARGGLVQDQQAWAAQGGQPRSLGAGASRGSSRRPCACRAGLARRPPTPPRYAPTRRRPSRAPAIPGSCARSCRGRNAGPPRTRRHPPKLARPRA